VRKPKSDKLDQTLRHWGRSFGERPPAEWDEDDSGGSGLLTGVLLDSLRVGMAKVGAEPIMGERVERNGTQIALLSQRFTAKGRQSEGGPRVWHPDPLAERVELAWLDMYRLRDPDPRNSWSMRAIVLRVEYCTRGHRRDKVIRAAKHLEVRKLRIRRYNLELASALVYMRGRLHDLVQEVG